jgi:hypothetical protein
MELTSTLMRQLSLVRNGEPGWLSRSDLEDCVGACYRGVDDVTDGYRIQWAYHGGDWYLHTNEVMRLLRLGGPLGGNQLRFFRRWIRLRRRYDLPDLETAPEVILDCDGQKMLEIAA